MTSTDLGNLADELAHISLPLLAAEVAPLTVEKLVEYGERLKRQCDVLTLMARHYHRAERFAPQLKRVTEVKDDDGF